MKRLIPFLVTLPSFFHSPPAFAQECLNGWCKAGCGNSGCHYVKVLSKNYPFVIYQTNGPDGMIKEEADCQQYKSRFLHFDGNWSKWIPAMPGTVGVALIKTACNM
jgi:hypothetical protein